MIADEVDVQAVIRLLYKGTCEGDLPLEVGLHSMATEVCHRPS